MNQDSTKFIGYITPDSSGRFILKDFNHSGISDVYLQAKDKKGHVKSLSSRLFPSLADSLRRAIAQPFSAGRAPVINDYIFLWQNNATIRVPMALC